MLNDASFRMLLLHLKSQDMVKAFKNTNFSQDQVTFIKALVQYVNEIARIVAKEEGELVAKL
jgi:hypothetical protein